MPHRLELLISPAWRAAPRPLRNVLERLEIEHLRHGGFNNGELYVSYLQFVEFGVSKRSIKPTLELGQKLGLLEVIQEAENHLNDIRAANAYRLTYVPAKGKSGPTDEWKAITEARAQVLLEAYRTEDKAAASATKKKRAA
ncbi:hypothetical protein [Pseudaminobacter soli (ex Li et al. 2025)]|nr:hypothetical protein [Mesorhizobium soli]